MPDTPVERLTYPCISDLQQRHWIQDLAEDADRALTRARSDIDYINNRPKAEMHRPTGTQSLTINTTTTLTYTTVDYDNANPVWANAAAGTLAPHIPGMYYVDVSTRLSQTSVNLPQSYVLDIQYNGITYLARKWNGGAAFFPLKLAGLIPVATHWPLPTLVARLTINGVGTPCLFERSRLAIQFLARCSVPLNANPYFEGGTAAPWTGQAGGAVSVQNVTPYRGFSTLRLQGPTSAATWSEAIPVTVAKRYIGQLWARMLAGATNSFAISIRWLDAANALISTSTGASQNAPTGSWQLYEVSALAPALAVTARLAFTHNGAAVTIDVGVDDAVFMAGCSA